MWLAARWTAHRAAGDPRPHRWILRAPPAKADELRDRLARARGRTTRVHSRMRGAVSLAAALALPKDFLKRNPIPDGPRRALLGLQVPLEEADERVAAERVHEQEG